jgi:hypothetical protein
MLNTKKTHLLAAILACCMQPVHANSPVIITQSTGEITIGNTFIQRRFSTSNAQLKTIAITNHRTDNQSTVFVPAQGSEEFVINLIAASTTTPQLTALSKATWSITANSYSTTETAPSGPPTAFIDGNISTHWHSNYGTGSGPTTPPFHIIIDLGKSETFQSFGYLPRQNGENGIVKEFELYVSETQAGLTTATACSKGILPRNGIQRVYAGIETPQTGRYVKFVIKSAWNGQAFGSGAEFDLYRESYTAPKTPIRTSDLELESTNWSQTLSDPGSSLITFRFKPYRLNNTDWNISMLVRMDDNKHYLRKQILISTPNDQRSNARIDYIDGEHLKVNIADAAWSRPTMGSGVGGMNGYLIATGQPLYIQGMFFGSEFPHTETSIDNDKIAHIRYFSGKSLATLQAEGRLNDQGQFETWHTVAGAARSTELQVIQNDFFSYINDIATPTKFRTQYNSWYDFMLDIDENNIQSSFYEMEKGFTRHGMPPLDSYVVDDGWNAYGPWKAANTTGFWQFNAKFPNGLTNAADLSHRFSSNFGLWLGPRGGYNYNGEFARFLETNGNGARNPATDDVITNHKRYLEKLEEFFLDNQNKYQINYWKFDGFTTTPPTVASEQYITGGEEGMYYMTEHWERWIDILKKIREKSDSQGQDMWINLTCYVNPSPWYLQWANSVWIQNSNDIGRINTGRTRQVDQLLTYRDGRYYDFVKTRQFQFPFANVYNHDPIYGKTGTNLANQMTDDEFRAYLYMMATRGTAFWELYYSYTMMNEGQKWRINAEFIRWASEHFSVLRNARLFGGNPDNAEVYGYSCWEGTEGIVSVRNPSTTARSFTYTLNRANGVKEDAVGLHRSTVLNFNTTTRDDNSGTYSYGQEIRLTLQPGEIRIWRFSAVADQTPASIEKAATVSSNKVSIVFNEPIDTTGAIITINDHAITSTSLLADRRTLEITTASALTAYTDYTLTITGLKDVSANKANLQTTLTHYPDALIAWFTNPSDVNDTNVLSEDFIERRNLKMYQFDAGTTLNSIHAVEGRGDFSIHFYLRNPSVSAQLLKQDSEFSVETNASGNIVFTVKGLRVISKNPIGSDNDIHLISLCREPNGMLKIYIDGKLDNSTYDTSNVNKSIAAGQLTIGSASFTGQLGRLEVYNRSMSFDEIKLKQNSLGYYYKVVATAGTGGTVAPVGATMVLSGTNLSVQAVPDQGYAIATIYVDGIKLPAMSKYTFYNIQKDRTFAAEFTPVSGTNPIPLNFSLYPNPAGNFLILETSSTAGVELYTITGILLKTFNPVNSGKHLLPIDELPAGIYLIKVIINDIPSIITITKQ